MGKPGFAQGAERSARPRTAGAWNRIGVPAALVFVATAAAQIGAARLQPHHGDFGTYRLASRALFAVPTGPLYDAAPGYVYPPFLAILIHPLHLLPEPWPGLVWDMGRWGCFACALLFCYRYAARRLRGGSALAVAVVGFVAGLRPMWRDTVNGNVNAYLLLALVLGWWWFRSGRAGRAGLLWSFMLAIKPGSAAVVLTPLAQRRSGLVRCWTACLAGMTIMNVLTPLLLFGPEATRIQLTAMPRGAADTADHVYSRYGNHSVGLAATRVINRLAGRAVEDPAVQPFGVARVVSSTVVAAWIALLLLRLRRYPRTAAIDYSVSLLGVSSTLLSPVVWVTHYLLLIPAYAVLLRARLAATRTRLRLAVFLLVGLAAGLIVLNAPILNTLAWSPLALLVGLTAVILFEGSSESEAAREQVVGLGSLPAGLERPSRPRCPEEESGPDGRS
jgi:alpha-1,2-mannosyltransferase